MFNRKKTVEQADAEFAIYSILADAEVSVYVAIREAEKANLNQRLRWKLYTIATKIYKIRKGLKP